MITLYIFLFLFLTVYGNTYNCSTKNDTILLPLNKIAFFSTTNFPALLPRHEFELCAKTFQLAENVKNYRAIFAVRQYYQSGTNIGVYSIFSNINNSDYSMENYMGKFSLSQEIQILFEDLKTANCPMESISPFKFIDETQIIYIKSTYDAEDLVNNFNRNFSCKWEFIAPHGYGFKIVFQVFNLASFTKLRIRNSTDIILNERSAMNNRAYYNEDKYLSIYLSETIPMILTDIEFQAYITVIKQNSAKTKINCSIGEYLGHDNATKWTLEQGYHNNGYCSYELVVLNTTEVYVTSLYYTVESYVDYIKYSIDNGTSEIFYDAPDITFTSYKNGSEKHVFFEFISDGSYIGYGFEIIFTVYDCKCAKKIVKCNQISGVTDDFNYHYCSNMKCKFILKPCKTSITVLSITANFEKDLLDEFKVISNNDVVFTLNEYSGNSHAEDGYIIYLNSSSHNIFDVTTHLSSGDKRLHFSTKPFKVPNVSTITLSSSIPYAIIETNSKKKILYEISKDSKNNTYVLYKNTNALINVFNNKSLTFNLLNKNCFSELNPFKCVITNDEFVVHVEEDPPPILAVKLANDVKNGCVFSETIFAENDETISQLANTDECLITILIPKPGGSTFHSFWTTSKKENVQVFIGTDQTKLLFEFNSESADKWYIIPYSNIYTIKIPRMAALLINYKFDPPVISNKTYNSVIATPGYGTFSIPWSEMTDLPFAQYNKNFEIRFTVLEMNLKRKNQFYFLVGDNVILDLNKKIHINKTGEVITLKKETVNLVYNSTNPNIYVILFVEIIF